MTTSTMPRAMVLRDVRKAIGLTQAEAAATIGRTRRTWIRWEDGTSPVDENLFDLFCRKHKRAYPRPA